MHVTGCYININFDEHQKNQILFFSLICIAVLLQFFLYPLPKCPGGHPISQRGLKLNSKQGIIYKQMGEEGHE